MTRIIGAKFFIKAALLLGLAAFGVAPARADILPSLNLYGTPGLIDMPGGSAMPDEHLSFSIVKLGPINRTTVSFQAAPWVSASLRLTTTNQWNSVVCPPSCTGIDANDAFFEGSADLRFHILDEGQFLPSITIGLMDVIGAGAQSGEYIAATKHIGDRFAVTGGFGWGRLGSEGGLGAPFGARPAGGALEFGHLFRGDVAPFWGVEWQVTDRWAAKAEYSSDSYAEEAGRRGIFEVKSPYNFGVEYKQSDMLRFGAYYLYGSQIGLSAQVILDPGKRPMGSMSGAGPTPVKPRVAYAADPEAWSQDWVTQAEAQPVLIQNLDKFLERSGVKIEALSYTGTVGQVRFRNEGLDAEAQAVGRVARAMTHLMPASVEVFEIVPMVGGVPASKVVLRRSDVETLEFAGDAAAAIRARAQIVDVGPPMANLARNPELYPKFSWAISPYIRIKSLERNALPTGDVGLRLSARYEVAPGLTFAGAITKSAYSTFSAPAPGATGSLPPVRSDIALYRLNGNPGLESLTAAWSGRVGTDLYGRVTVGYLEPMFGGVSTELLWSPSAQRWAMGVETNYVAQRDTDGGFGFGDYDYQTLSGHVSGYYDLGSGYHAQVDLGRYLAEDFGGTLSLTRRFETGWKVGSYVTATNAPGSDRLNGGLKIEIPMSWLFGQPSRASTPVTLEPYVSDGGARLKVDRRLHDLLIDYSAVGLDEQWGRFWK
jgi:hypothetical protein